MIPVLARNLTANYQEGRSILLAFLPLFVPASFVESYSTHSIRFNDEESKMLQNHDEP